MDTTYFSYPRIPLDQATKLWGTIRSLSLPEITQTCDNVSLTGVEFYPLAENRADEEELRYIRRMVLDLALRYDFPTTTSSRPKVAFETELIQLFHNEINMSPAEASHMDVWHYFNLKLLTDVLVWRWGSNNNPSKVWSITPERIYGFNRNMFGRIWWRNHLLGPEIASKLSEDATVAIVERPKLFSYPPFAKAVAARALNSETSMSHTNILREVTRLFSRKMAVLSVYSMRPGVLDSFVDEVFLEAELAMIEYSGES